MIFSEKYLLLLFDFHDEGDRPRRLCFANPKQIFVADSVSRVRSVLGAAERAAQEGFYVAGFVSYEAAPALDPALAVRDGTRLPLAWFAVFGEVSNISSENALPPTKTEQQFPTPEWQSSISQAAYCNNVAAIFEAIVRGETYQVNYSMRLRTKFGGDPVTFYEHLRSAQRGRYCAYLDIGRHQILSVSPELFFRRSGSRIVTRPMKGTEQRGRYTAEDDVLQARLRTSEKEQAENVMIVDLIRNDLGRIAETGTVEVSRLFKIEKYPTVLQMTSTVEADLKKGTTLEEIFAALFPCGSVTGAPKVSTMKLIAQLEDSPREIYCGTIGLLKPGGDCVFNVAIRTLVIDSLTGTAVYGIGGGITWGSTPLSEYEEALAKAKILTEQWPVFKLLETMKLESGSYTLLGRHLQRLTDSARYFEIPFSLTAVKHALQEYANNYSTEPRRVRLLVSQAGGVEIQSKPLYELPDGSLPVKLADKPNCSSDRMLYHKTTHREIYEAHRVGRSDTFDTLLWNERGELTEFTRGNLVVEQDGRLWTPPVNCGLLPGTLRAELLESGEIVERVVLKDELLTAAAIWFINSVRGWQEVHLIKPILTL